MRHGDFDCFLLAGRYTLLEQGGQEELFPACRRKGVSIILGGPFNSGILVRAGQADATYNYAAVPPEIRARVEKLARGLPRPWRVAAGRGLAVSLGQSRRGQRDSRRPDARRNRRAIGRC